MVEVTKSQERTCQEYQVYKQAHSGTLTLSFKPVLCPSLCGKCRGSHNHGECAAWGQTCHQCGKKNHWSQMCGVWSNSSTGYTPSPHKQQNREEHQAKSTRKASREIPTTTVMATRRPLPRSKEVAT